MIKKYTEKYEKTRNIKNNDKTKKYILRGERNQTYGLDQTFGLDQSED